MDMDIATISKVEQRQSQIMQLLIENRSYQVKELATELDVSLMTVHRDLQRLQEQGLIRRVRGSVTVEKSMLFESSYLIRMRQNIEEKRRLARAASRYVESGNAIVMDDSSTVFHVTEHLPTIVPVTIITNALPIMERLREVPDIDMIGLGGKYNHSFGGFFGIACEQAIRSYRADVALLSMTAVQGLSLFTPDEECVRVKRAMMEISRKKILLIDESKFQFTALNYVADMTDFDTVLLSGDIDPAIIDKIAASGVHFEQV